MSEAKALHELPSTYTPLDYLENVNSAYISLNVTTDFGQVFEAEIYPTSTSDQAVLGGRTGWGNGAVLWYNNGKIVWSVARTDAADNNCPINAKYYVKGTLPEQNNSPFTLQVNNNTVTRTFNSQNVFAGQNLLPFRAANDTRYFTGRLYWYKVTKNDEVQIWLIPCISDSNEYGMWDKVEGKFYGSSNSAVFTGQTLTT